MTTINNDDFTIKEKNMTTKELEKIAPDCDLVTPVQEHAIKNVAKTIVSRTDAIHEAEEREKEAEARLDVENAITTLQREADSQKQLINAVNDKNQALQDKLNIINDNNIKIVIPNATLEDAINEAIMRMQGLLTDSVREVNDVMDILHQDDMQEALRDVGRINDLKNRVCDLEDVDTSRLDDLDYDIESEVQSQLGNCYYVEEDEVNNMIDDRLEEFVTRDDINHDLRIYGREINELKARLDNTIYNKVCRLVKSIFSYNLSNKVRSIFKRNKKEGVMPSKK